jgi:hypothetical protein
LDEQRIGADAAIAVQISELHEGEGSERTKNGPENQNEVRSAKNADFGERSQSRLIAKARKSENAKNTLEEPGYRRSAERMGLTT